MMPITWIVWIFTFLFPVIVVAERPSAEEINSYKKKFSYKYLVEPFLKLDKRLRENTQLQVTHCSILTTEPEESIIRYKGLGSCIYDQISFAPEEREARQVIIHTLINQERPFDLTLKWDDLSIKDVFRAYWNKNPLDLETKISLTSTDPDQNISEFFKNIFTLRILQDLDSLEEVSQKEEKEENMEEFFDTLSESEPLLSKIIQVTNYIAQEIENTQQLTFTEHLVFVAATLDINKVEISIYPYEEQDSALTNQHLTIDTAFMDTSGDEIFDFELVTDYFPGAKEFSIFYDGEPID